MKTLHILGTRGIPAAHGGFETLAHMLSLYMIDQGWRVRVYCQIEGEKTAPKIDNWQGVERVLISEARQGALGTIFFDYKAIKHALKNVDPDNDVVLTLGYNTAIFSAQHKSHNHAHIMNMDGIEWKREKWGFFERLFLFLNERIGLRSADALIADHPEIKKYLCSKAPNKTIRIIPYSAFEIEPLAIDAIRKFGVNGKPYFTVIARPEPENQTLEIVRAFSRKKRNANLLVLGKFKTNCNYHKKILNTASSEVLFPGAIYDRQLVATIRHYCRAYIHGHTVGGTNPSLVEALCYANPIIAADNRFNRWTAGEAQLFFNDETSLSELIEKCIEGSDIESLSKSARLQFEQKFSYSEVMGAYHTLVHDIQQADGVFQHAMP